MMKSKRKIWCCWMYTIFFYLYYAYGFTYLQTLCR